MTVKLNKRAYDHAKRLVKEDEFVLDERDAWSEHRPSAARENDFINQHGLNEYSKGRYKFPYGDLEKVHRCGVLTVESRAGQYKYYDIENAAAHLHGMIDKVKA